MKMTKWVKNAAYTEATVYFENPERPVMFLRSVFTSGKYEAIVRDAKPIVSTDAMPGIDTSSIVLHGRFVAGNTIASTPPIYDDAESAQLQAVDLARLVLKLAMLD